MAIELKAKEQITTLLENEFLINLLRDKKHVFNKHAWIELEGTFNFSLRWENDRLIIDVQDIQPKVTAKMLLKIQGRLNKISIGKNDIILSLVGLPDQTIVLT